MLSAVSLAKSPCGWPCRIERKGPPMRRVIDTSKLPKCGNCIWFAIPWCPRETKMPNGTLEGPHPEASPCDRYKSMGDESVGTTAAMSDVPERRCDRMYIDESPPLIDAMAVAICNSIRRDHGLSPIEDMSNVECPDTFRRQAAAALAAAATSVSDTESKTRTMDWATEIAAHVQASLEGSPYVSDDVERIAAALRAEREACADVARNFYRRSTFNSRIRSIGQDAADGIAAAIRNRST